MGLKTRLHSGPGLLLKIHYPNDGTEKVIGYASNLTYSINQGQKAIFGVDSPFPSEIAQAASPSMVRGSLTVYLPKGSTPELAGLVPFRTDASGITNQASSKYLNIRIYDRITSGLIMSLDFCKFSQYNMMIQARQIVRVDLAFEGFFATPGNSS